MPELEILEAKVPVRTPVLVKEAETASSRLGPVAGWLSGPVFSRARDIFAANMADLLDRAEDPARMIRMIIIEMEETLVEVRATAARSIASRTALLCPTKVSVRSIISIQNRPDCWCQIPPIGKIFRFEEWRIFRIFATSGRF